MGKILDALSDWSGLLFAFRVQTIARRLADGLVHRL